MFDAKSCAVISALHSQSPDIAQGVNEGEGAFKEQGAGDQGMMFGYASKETDNLMPLTLELSHLLVKELAAIRKEGKNMTYLRPDAKSQVTIEYSDDNQPVRIDAVVVSTQHDDFVKPADSSRSAKEVADKAMTDKISADIHEFLLPRVKSKLPARVVALFNDNIKYYINPTGVFIIGGPHGDTGLTGRKIIVDTFGGRGAHGGGAFSGKDPSKVDRSAAYAMRWVAKNVVAAGLATRCEVQVAYAIGKAQPVGVFVETFGTGTVAEEKIQQAIHKVFDLRPAAIIADLELLNTSVVQYRPTAAYGHFGRPGFTWERIDRAQELTAAL
jgi:S-adenosylmethionine synthetase